jgi:hypothetical protein
MNFFRSEEHIARFNTERSLEPGATIGSGQLCELGHEWWETRLSPDWRPRARDESQAILEHVGLTGEFWRLPGG